MNIIPFPGTEKKGKLPFEQVYEKYYPEVLHYVQGKTAGYHDAEDLTGDIFLYCYRNYEKYDPTRSSLATWLYLIVNSRLKNYYRDRKEHVDFSELEDYLFDEETDMERSVYLEELRDCLSEKLLLLPEKQRKAIILRYFRDWDYSDIAKELDVSPGNARVMISRALDKLEAEFTKTGSDWRIP